MDCVNHSGVKRPPIARTAARRSAPTCVAQCGRRAGSLRALLDGLAELSTALCRASRRADPIPWQPRCWD